MIISQKELFPSAVFARDASDYFSDAPAEARGGVHTRPEVTSFILDAVGWTADQPLETMTLLEPCMGEGDFLVPAVERLLGRVAADSVAISGCIRAVEVGRASLAICRSRLGQLFAACGWSPPAANRVLDAWLIHGDFLTVDLPEPFSHIVGNPPYIRLEHLPKPLLDFYRKKWTSLFDRADLYVAFFEKSLGLLAPEGRLGFICADRWMKNRYGGPLREMVATGFHLDAYVDFTGCPAFFGEVDAYPAVTIIRRGRGKTTRVAFRPNIQADELAAVAVALRDNKPHPLVSQRHAVSQGRHPWHFDELGTGELIRAWEKRFPRLEEAGCKVGIGVATGADKVFIGSAAQLDVESDRKLPLVMTRDIREGRVEWSGHWVLNPFNPDGLLVDLASFPRFHAYLEKHHTIIAARHVAGHRAAAWYRTIDRIHEPLTHTPKLLIPDIKGTSHVVLEHGKYYPHHNLYYILSRDWPLPALRALLASRIAYAFIAAYSPVMRGGYLRFQAQYLRRIRIPQWDTLDPLHRVHLTQACAADQSDLIDDALQAIYQISATSWKRLDQTMTRITP